MSKKVYVLQLEGGRYYIGASDNVTKTYEEHVNGLVTAWTKMYKPVLLDMVFDSIFADLDKITKEFMSDHSIDMVRGGSYTDVELSEKQVATLKKEIAALKDPNALKPLKFTVCYRKTVFIYVNSEFTEEDFIGLLSEENWVKWAALTAEKRKKIWLKLRKDFPFEVGGDLFDPHKNWIEAWDDDVNEEEEMAWDGHDYLKEEIMNKVAEIEEEMDTTKID